MSVTDVRPPLGEDLADLADMVTAFSADRLAGPAASAEASDTLPPELPAELAAQGLWTLGVSEHRGGGGADLAAVTVAVQRLATVTPVAAVAVTGVHAAVFAVVGAAAVPVAAAATSGGLPLLIDTADPLTSVRLARCGEGWSVEGTAARVEGAGDAALFVLTDPQAGAVLIEPSLPGCLVHEPMGRTGLRGLAPHAVTFSQVRLPGGAALPADRARAHAVRLLLLGAAACGIAESAWSAACHYTSGRVQFSRPLAGFPAVAVMLDEMAAEVADRFAGLVSAAAALDRPAGAALHPGSLARSCARTAVRVADRAIQLHGGYGYLAEYRVERALRDAVTLQALVAAATEGSAGSGAIRPLPEGRAQAGHRR